MKRKIEYLFAWTFGGGLYYGMELTFRGFSHWSMFVLGGTCFLYCYMQGVLTAWSDPLWLQILRCSTFITAGEFFTGIIVNKWFQWNVWDYSDQPWNLFGQICIPFIVIFSGLSLIGIFLCIYISHHIFQEEKEPLHIL